VLVATSPIEFRNGLDGLVILLHETLLHETLLHETLGMIRSAGRSFVLRFMPTDTLSLALTVSLKLESTDLFGLPPQY
jgi:hypothetical protein